MSSMIASIAQKLHGELDGLINRVSQVGEGQPSVHETEEQIWQGILHLGRGLMELRMDAVSEAEEVQDVVERNGISYHYERQRERGYVSLFGEVRFKRAYYLNAECGGMCPLDAVLSMPERCYSDSVQERLSEVNVWVPQPQSLALVERWLGLKIPKGSLQASASDCMWKITTSNTQCHLPQPKTIFW